MKEINYALAPSGATHEYNGMWRKGVGVRWYSWYQGAWMLIDAVCLDEYEPIPDRELALNRLADNYVDFCQDHRLGITDDQVKARRVDRLELGFIKQNNELGDVSDTKPKEWINGLPPVGVEFNLKPYWNRVKVIAHNVRRDGVDIVYFDYHLNCYDFSNRPDYFRPIKTPEQIAAEKRSAWIYKAQKHCTEFCSNQIGKIYDALLSGELEAPKGGL